MKRTNRTIRAAIILLMAISIQPSVFAGQGTTGGQILDLVNGKGGTRAAALGDAFAAIDGDVTTALWNPSGLGVMAETQAAFSYVDGGEIFGEAGEGLYDGFFAGALPLREAGTLGAALQLQGQGTILVTTDSPDPIREENLGTNWALTVSYADRLAPELLAGISGKIIQMKLGPESGRAYAVDLGLQYNLPHLPIPIRIGAAVQNWGTRIAFKDENQSDPLPRVLRLGTAVTVYEEGHHYLRLIGDATASIHKLKEDEDELNADLDRLNEQRAEKSLPELTRGELLSDRGVGIHAFEWRHMQKSLGVEYWLGNLLALRVGYKGTPGVIYPTADWLFFSDTTFPHHLTYGLGVRLLNYQFDYALIPAGGPENTRLNVFALMLRF